MRKRDSTWLKLRKMATVAKSEYDRGSCNADKARLQTKRQARRRAPCDGTLLMMPGIHKLIVRDMLYLLAESLATTVQFALAMGSY
jgi:hypothetical protein